MASLPPVAVAGNTVKLDPLFKKLPSPSLPFEKKNYIKSDKEQGPFREALSSIREAGNGKLESSSYVPILQECIENSKTSSVEPLHAHMMKTGFCEDLFLMTLLVKVYSKRGMMESARRVFDNSPNRNVVTWTSLMSGYVRNSQPESAVGVFKEMLGVRGYPTVYTLGVVVNACSALCDIEFGKQVHGYIVKYNIGHDASIGNALCSLYSKCRSLDMALKAFHKIEEKNVISWTALISACGDNGNSALGLDTFVKMLMEGVEPNEITLTSVLSLCCMMRALDLGSQVHSLSVKLGYESDIPVMNSIMYLYLKSGCITGAMKLFDGMNNNISLVTWNTMIAGHAEMITLSPDGLSAYLCGIEALKIFESMRKLGLKPDLYTFSSVLSICGSLVALEQGEQVHAQTIKTGSLSDMVVETALVNMYNKCGSIESSSKAFVEMSSRTLISWTTMITAYAQHGHSLQALHLFDDMRFIGVRPNKTTFVGVLLACSQAGRVDNALAYYDMMRNEYKINPVVDHVACLVNMFMRLGLVDEAFDLVKNSDLAPNEFIWSILTAGCRSQGRLELGFYAAERLLELKPREPETYFLLLDLYISAGRWREVSCVRKMMREEKVSKITDLSWISIKDKVYSFKRGDHEKQGSEEVAKVLEKIETVGPGENEEDATTTHSEKVAVAFGLLNTLGHADIRIVKSMSMCRECHGFMKHVSMLTSRTIVVQDSKRLHQFSGGQCSCKDFGSFD